jgi:N-glycosylase/DNA lyase
MNSTTDSNSSTDGKIVAANVEAARSIVAVQRATPFFQRRYHRNVQNPPQSFCKEEFWKQMIVCMCTSVQPSGPQSRLSKFVREKPFPLSLEACETKTDLRAYAETILRSRGLRFGSKIAGQIETNLAWLRNGGWRIAEDHFTLLAQLPVNSSAPHRIAAERTAARFLMGRTGGLVGFGPKQARNLWQCLGVTLYEIPLDSRICAWLNALPLPFGVKPERLYGSVPYYEATMSHIQALCHAAGIFPCEFDAAVFAAADTDEWPEDDEVF